MKVKFDPIVFKIDVMLSFTSNHENQHHFLCDTQNLLVVAT